MSQLNDLHELDWIPVPNYAYLLKYSFSNSGYNLLVSNLTSLYEEKMTETDVEARFTKLNPHVKMKPRVILENVKKSLKDILSDESNFSLKLDENRVIIELNFHAGHVLCKYDIEMNLMPAEKVLEYVIAPTILGALLSQRKVLALQKIVTSGERIKSSPSKTVSSQNVLEPDWLKGKNVPHQIVYDSFLSLQSHFKDLSAENCKAYVSSRNVKSVNEKTINSVVPHKKIKQIEDTKCESSINFEEDDGCKPIKEEETDIDASMQEPPRIVKKKKVFKF